MDRSACYHAPATLAYQNRDLTLQVIVPDGEGDLIDLFLLWQTEGEGSVRMLPADGLSGEESFTVYAATVKAADMTGDRLCYRFVGAGFESSSYQVPLGGAPRLPGCPAGLGEADFLPITTCFEQEPAEEEEALPAILPIAPLHRVYHSFGELSIRFAVAGKADYPTVYIKQEGEYIPHAARPCKKGCYEVVLPYRELSMLSGRLFYFIRVSNGSYTAQYGNAEEPITVRVVDNMGPAVLSAYPADGVCVKEDKPVIEIRFADVSGVSRRRSILCLDGRNVSEGAQWGEKSVIFQPKRSLSHGRHIVEVVLRDRLGNRSYHRVEFAVGEYLTGGEEAKAAGRSGRARSIRAALLFANLFATLKDIFSTKDE